MIAFAVTSANDPANLARARTMAFEYQQRGHRSARSVPKIALACGFLGGVRPWRASVRPCGSPHGALAQGGGLRGAGVLRRGAEMPSRAHSSSAPS